MKKNRMMRLASLLLVLVLMTSSVVGGTFAKYTSKATASDTARVAKWEILVDTVNIAQETTQIISFDLFSTIYDTDGGAAEDNVAANLLAPGTKGSFTVDITNNSEVDAQIKATLSAVETHDLPIQYSLDGVSGWTNELADLSVDEAVDMNGGKATVTVHWQWVYSTGEAGDTADTKLGILAAAGTDVGVTVTMAVEATQID